MAIDRRTMLVTGAVALTSLAVPVRVAAQEVDASADLLAGGGAVETALGTVDFGLVAQLGAAGAVTGTLSVRGMTQPGNPVVLQSTQLNRLEAYGDNSSAARQLVGWVTTGGATAIFVLRLEDLGGPGSGQDIFSLYVGTAAAPFLEGEEASVCDCADFSYSLEGPVVAGDIIVAPQSRR